MWRYFYYYYLLCYLAFAPSCWSFTVLHYPTTRKSSTSSCSWAHHQPLRQEQLDDNNRRLSQQQHRCRSGKIALSLLSTIDDNDTTLNSKNDNSPDVGEDNIVDDNNNNNNMAVAAAAATAQAGPQPSSLQAATTTTNKTTDNAAVSVAATTSYPINLPSPILLALSIFLSIASIGSGFELLATTSGGGNSLPLGFATTAAVAVLGIPTCLFLFYAAVLKGKAETEEDDKVFRS